MILSYNTDRTIITISSSLLDDFIATPEDYTDVDIQIYFNSTTSSTTETYSEDDLITDVTNVATDSGVTWVNPAFFNTTEFSQGIYHVVITLTSTGSIQTDEGCIFIESTIACDVNDYRLLSTVDLNKRLNVGIDYYMLTKSQSCTCGCDNLVEIYNNLITTLANNTCSTC